MVKVISFNFMGTGIDNLRNYEATISGENCIATIYGQINKDTGTCHIASQSQEILDDLKMDSLEVMEAIEKQLS